MRFDFVPFFNPGENIPWDRVIKMMREQTKLAEQGDFTTVWPNGCEISLFRKFSLFTHHFNNSIPRNIFTWIEERNKIKSHLLR